MLRFCTKSLATLARRPSAHFSSSSEGDEFLNMVEKYFDKAGQHTNIRPDLLNFYKKADNVIKFNLTLIRGIHKNIQTMSQYKSYLPIDVNIKLTSYRPKAEQGMPKT